ncbi:eIF4-gamma/eIF5/eIF2-epsilon [Xylariaceae sp. FL1272]|nr:eIF4-gamma/eIF5/eIF2-epsilon [Xylariaceae sp. FL1272]
MSQSKGGRGGSAAKGKKGGAKPAAEEKGEDVLQAVIIADGFQSRFLPFSIEKPRCLLPLANTPLIEYTLEFLAMNGVQEVFIYAGAHYEMAEDYVQSSRWAVDTPSCPFFNLEFIPVADAHSVGDFLRDLDKRNLIRGDFLLVNGDVVSNLYLDKALAAHKARREANRDSCMTMVLREVSAEDHYAKAKAAQPVFVIDPKQNRCLHYEEITPFQSEHYVDLDPAVLENAEAESRTDLIDPQIDICTPDVLALWSESFDYELPRLNFLHGVLKDWELNGKLIHTEIVNEGYCARASDLRMYDMISKDLLAGWAFPFTPEMNLLNDQTYRCRNGIYREDGVYAEDDSDITNSVLGQDTIVGSGTRIQNSIIGRNCRIGNNVRISDSHIWENTEIADDVVIEHAVIGESVFVAKGTSVHEGALVSSGVRIEGKDDIEAATVLSTLSHEAKPLELQPEAVGAGGKGAVFEYPEHDEQGAEEVWQLECALVYSLDNFDIEVSSVSTLDDDDFISDSDDEDAPTPSHSNTRSRLSSFASDDSAALNNASFHTDAVNGLLEVLRGGSGNFDSEKVEFTSLRLANNASDAAMRKAVATAFVRRAVELMNAESDAVNAAKDSLTSRTGATSFVQGVGVGSDSVTDQVEFTLAVQRACVRSSIEVGKAGSLLAAMLQQMYDNDVLEEEGIIAWWEDARGKDGDNMTSVRAKCQVLVEWLENASEEESDDDDDDDSE